MSHEIINNVEIRTPDTIAAEIRSAIQIARKTVIVAVTEIGQKLIEAKELVPHGEWSDWLKDQVNFSERTAQTYMKIAAAGTDVLKTAETADLTISNALKLIALPEDAQKEVMSAVDSGEISPEDTAKKIEEMRARILELEAGADDIENAAAASAEEIERLRSNLAAAEMRAEHEREKAEDLARKAKEAEKKQADKIKAEADKQLAAARKELEENVAAASTEEIERLRSNLAVAEMRAERAEKEKALAASEEKTVFKLIVKNLQLTFRDAIKAIVVPEGLEEDDRKKMKAALKVVLDDFVMQLDRDVV